MTDSHYTNIIEYTELQYSLSGSQNLKYLLFGPLQKKLADPWFRYSLEII